MSHEAEVRDRFRMNDQQWVLQRKKIGLSRRNKKALHTRLVEERQKMSAITYIHTHFNRKECTKFVPTSGQVKTIDIKYFWVIKYFLVSCARAAGAGRSTRLPRSWRRRMTNCSAPSTSGIGTWTRCPRPRRMCSRCR